jgi:hypothetical protein
VEIDKEVRILSKHCHIVYIITAVTTIHIGRRTEYRSYLRVSSVNSAARNRKRKPTEEFHIEAFFFTSTKNALSGSHIFVPVSNLVSGGGRLTLNYIWETFTESCQTVPVPFVKIGRK